MIDEQFEDLKQPIESRATATERYIDQRIEENERRMDAGLDQRVGGTEQHVDTKPDAVLDGERADTVDTVVQHHELI